MLTKATISIISTKTQQISQTNSLVKNTEYFVLITWPDFFTKIHM